VVDVRQTEGVSLDALIDQFEEARASGGAEIESFLPPSDHPDHGDILVELIRVELELGWEEERRPALAEYRARFADAFTRAEQFAPIAFEEYRLRRAAGEPCTREEYRDRYDIATNAWPELPVGSTCSDSDAASEWLHELSRTDPASASRIAGATRELPEIGDQFLNFELVGELGRGAFGRVFLARQGDLANRFVALKVTAQISDEPQRLAQLQHTNIVPIYSLHQLGALQAVCMPFLGPNTLADVLQSFQARRSTSLSGRVFASTMEARDASTVVGRATLELIEHKSADGLGKPANADTLRRLDKMSYADAATWVVGRLARGLSHAHEHGIVHRDLKPANILLTDLGEPLILDFNLSSQSSAVGSSAAMIGGTLPYMAPEHITALQQGNEVGPTADIYSLGVILFEMLTGGSPYTVRQGSLAQVTSRMLEDRRQPAPSVRERNAAISHDLASIVAKCLELAPQDRYQTAKDLQQDLDRHLAQLPLLHAPNRSVKERMLKWRRRHPRLLSAATMTAVAGVVIVTLLMAWVARGRTIARAEASRQADQFLEQVGMARTTLNIPGVDERSLREALESADKTAAMYDLLGEHELPNEHDLRGGVALDQQPGFRLVSLKKQSTLRRRGAELLYLLGGGKAALGQKCGPGPEREQLYRQALAINIAAESVLASATPPKAFLLQRARLLQAAGQEQSANEWRARADQLSANSEFDRYLLAFESGQRHDFQTTAALLETLLRDKPQDYSAWFGLGSAHFGAGRFAKAEGCYTTCIALRPKLHLAYLMRGVSRLQQQAFGEAKQDFDAVLQLRPHLPSALVNRALARRGLAQPSKAIADISAALDAGAEETRIYFIRANFKEQIGDVAGAKADRAEGLRRTPRDALSWIARGVAHLPDAPEQSLSDFQQALVLDPHSTVALQNIAHVLSERLHRNDEALAAMDRLVEMNPDDQRARANRGVLRARLGRRAEAIADAEASARGQASAPTIYRVACIYALLAGKSEGGDTERGDTERNNPHDGLRKQAVKWLGKSLRAQPALVATALRDQDLAALRDDPTFRRLLGAARALEQTTGQNE